MNVAGYLTYDTKLDTDGFTSGLNTMSSKTVAVGTIMANVFQKVAQSVVNIVKSGVEYNAQIEQYQVALTTLTGSADEASKVIEQIKKDAKTTPFDVQSLTQANQLLISTGISSDQAREDVLALGNAISATGGGDDELSRMAVNLQQIKNVGKATALDIKQFAYAGIDVYTLLADYTGKTKEEVADMDITYEDLTGALKMASQEGGKYYGAMENQSKTLNGQLSNLKDNWGQFVGKLAAKPTEILTNTILPKLNELLENLGDKIEKIDWDEVGEKLKLIGAVLTPIVAAATTFFVGLKIVKAIKAVKDAFVVLNAVMAANPILLVVAAIAALVAGFIYLWNTSEDFRNFWINLWNKIVEFTKPIIDKIVEIFKEVWEAIKAIWDVVGPYFEILWNNLKAGVEAVKNIFESAFKTAWEIIKAVWDVVSSYFSTLWDTIKGIFSVVKDVLTGDFQGAWDGIKGIFSSWGDYFNTLWSSVKKIFGSVAEYFKDVGTNLVKGLWNGINNAKDWILDKIKGFGKSVLNGLKSFFGIKSPSRVMRNVIGKNLILGVGVSLDKDSKLIDSDIDSFGDEITSKMQNAVNLESGKYSVSGINGSVTDILSSNATFDGDFTVQAKVQEGVLFEANQRITKEKRLQTGFGG